MAPSTASKAVTLEADEPAREATPRENGPRVSSSHAPSRLRGSSLAGGLRPLQPPHADAHALVAHVKSPLDSLQAPQVESSVHFLQSSGEVQVQMHSP